MAGARRVPRPAAIAARAARGGRVHRRRRVHRPVDRLLPEGLRPDLRVVVLEAAFAGFGASGRNGGWVTAELRLAGPLRAGRPAGTPGCAAWRRRCGRQWTRSGGSAPPSRSTATSSRAGGCRSPRRRPARPAAAPELPRLGGGRRGRLSSCPRPELASRVNMAGALGGLFAPRPARIQPAALAAGLAEAAERRGVVIYEATPVSRRSSPGTGPGPSRGQLRRRARPGRAALHRGLHRQAARAAPRAAADEQLHGRDRAAGRRHLAGDRLGRVETLSDEAHAYIYAQRTADGRIAIGGRGVPYRFGSAVDDRGETAPATVEALRRCCAGCSRPPRRRRLDHAWSRRARRAPRLVRGGELRRRSGLGWAGGYSGHGVLAANLAGRTLADLVAGEQSDLTALPWVGHHSRTWEPEPARWAGVHGLYALYRRRTGWSRRGRPRRRPGRRGARPRGRRARRRPSAGRRPDTPASRSCRAMSLTARPSTGLPCG